MGNAEGKKAGRSEDEERILKLYSSLANKNGLLARKDLQVWNSLIDTRLHKAIEHYIFAGQKREVKFDEFKRLYANICTGYIDDKVDAFVELVGTVPTTEIALTQFIEGMLWSILLYQQRLKVKTYCSWLSRNTAPEDSSLPLLAISFLIEIKKDGGNYSKDDLQILLNKVQVFLIPIIAHLFGSEDDSFLHNLFPLWQYNSLDRGHKLQELSNLDMFRIMFINYELPVEQQDEWRLLFSSKIHGESFSRLTSQAIQSGPTVFIIQDKDGHIFGVFASVDLAYNPSFVGSSSSFLFTLYPAMNIYQSTGFNDHYQYLNVGQQTLPNCLGFGGQLEYFGLCLDSEFGKGYCSESCTTFRNYKMMSRQKEFQIASVEVWGVGVPKVEEEEDGPKRTILDSNIEAKAIMELAGKTMHSDGLREPEPDD